MSHLQHQKEKEGKRDKTREGKVEGWEELQTLWICCTLATQEVLFHGAEDDDGDREGVRGVRANNVIGAKTEILCQRKKGVREVLLTLSCCSLPGGKTGMHAGVWTRLETTISVAKGPIILSVV